MNSCDRFLHALNVSTGRIPNTCQKQAVEADKAGSLFIIAGPGTGKTATLTMRMLKLILVDGILPRGILATTFTKKAAQELRSRLLSWGYAVQEHLLTKEKLSKMDRLWLDRVDVNQVGTGTIDSVCEELLHDFRDPGIDPPTSALETFRPEGMPPEDPSAICPDVKKGGIDQVDAYRCGRNGRLCFMVAAMESQ